MPVSRSLDALLDQEYMPVMFSQRHHQVVLRKLADIDLDEPFYGGTPQDDGDPGCVTVPLEEFMAWIRRLPWPQRPRIICHTGRCGSTLLTNMLALSNSTIMLREPGFLNDALLEDLKARRSGAAVTWDFTVGMLKYCTCAASASNRLIVIKASSWGTVDLLAGVRPLTGGSWLSLWRDPVDVVASQLHRPPGWSRSSAVLSALGYDLDGYSNVRRSQVGLFVAMWCRAAKAFIATSQSQCLFSYDQLTSDPLGTLAVADQWLGIIDDPPEDLRLRQVLGRYSKDDPRRARPAAAVPRRTLSDPNRRLVTQATDSLVATLKSLSGWEPTATASIGWP
jgi:hypothetical protein